MNQEKIKNTLDRIGFSPNEIKIYLTLNKNGSTKAGEAASLAKIDRSSAYNSLKSLQEKGMVSSINVGKIKSFQVTGPKRILEYLKEQEQDVKEILPQLEEMHKTKKVESKIKLFKGEKGLKNVFLDIIKTEKNNFVIGSEGQFSERMPEFISKFQRMKKEKEIRTKNLVRKGRKNMDNKTSEHRYILGIEKSPAVTSIYGDKIAIMVWTDEPEAIVIENKEAAKAYKSYFDFMWKHGEQK